MILDERYWNAVDGNYCDPEVGVHSYATWECSSCGKEMCWSCAVKCVNDGTGEGPITCPHCNSDEGYYKG